MNIKNKTKRYLVLVLGVFAFNMTLNAQETGTPIDVNNIMTTIHSHYQGNEFLLDTHVVYVPAENRQDYAAIAFDGTNYLVVWVDLRTYFNYTLFGARISASGVLLDSAGIVISDRFSWKLFPSVSFNGENYLVVWHNYLGDLEEDIYGARVAPSGVVLDPDGIIILEDNYRQCDPAVASDGTNYLVVWADERNGSNNFDIYGARVSASGIVLDPDGIEISIEDGIQGDPGIVFDGVNYFVVWDDNRQYPTNGADIYGARVTPGGAVLDPSGIAISKEPDHQSLPSIATNDSIVLVAWMDERNGPYDVYCCRIDESGIVLDTAGIFISSTGDSWTWFLSAGCDGENYLVTWHDYVGTSYDLYGARVSRGGVVLDTTAIPISTGIMNDEFEPAVAFGSTSYLVVWQDCRIYWNINIYGSRVDTSGTVLDPEGLIVSSSAYNQVHSSIAFDGTNHFVVWQDTRMIDENIHGVRLDSTGTILDPACIPIIKEASRQLHPAVAFDGTNYFVVWDDARDNPEGFYPDIYGARVNPSGIVLDTTGIPISCVENVVQRNPVISFGDSLYLAIWEDRRNSGSDIYATRIHPSGTILDTAGIIVTIQGTGRNPAIAFDGTNYFTVWQQGGSSNYDVFSARINQAGVVIDTNAILISNASGPQENCSVAFNGMYYFVVWSDYRDGSICSWDIYGARVTTDGVVLDPNGIPLCMAPNAERNPCVTPYGDDFLVVWDDRRDGRQTDLYGVLVDSSGVIINSFVVCNQPGEQLFPAIVKGSGEQSLITYTGWVDSIGNRSANTMRIWSKFYPLVGIEEKSDWGNIPTQMDLHIYPNPINNQCNINYALNQKSKVSISLYDVTGRLVKNILDESKNPGNYNNVFDITNLPQGVYFIRLSIESHSVTKKVVFIK